MEAEHADSTYATDVYPALGLSGGKGLHFSTDATDHVTRFFVRFRFSAPRAGRYALWTRRHLLYIDIGTWPMLDRLRRYVGMEWRIDDGVWHRTPMETPPVSTEGRYPNSIGHLGFSQTGDGETAAQYIGWYLDDFVELTEGEHVFETRFYIRQTTMTPVFRPEPHRYYGLLDAVVVAEPGFVPEGRIAPPYALPGYAPPDRAPEKRTVFMDLSTTGHTVPILVPGLSMVSENPLHQTRYRDVRPPLIRLPHLYTAAKVSVDTAGRVSIDWTELDRLVDRIFEMGSEPIMCISYTPAAISSIPPGTPPGPVTGDPGMYAPSDYALWEEVVYRTVRHFNVERKLNIRYWEVWNEPNNVFLQIWPIWSWTDRLPFINVTLEYVKKLVVYCRIYEHAARGAVRADPSIRIGGPAALCDGNPGNMAGSTSWWVKTLAWWCYLRDLRFDFISLHLYAGSPDSVEPAYYGRLIQNARQWAKVGNLAPEEVIIDEWNVFSMEGGHDTVTEYHAAWVMETMFSMMQAGARHTVYFGSGTSWPGLFSSERYTPTPAYNLFKMVAMLEPDRLAVASEHGDLRVLVSRSASRITLLAWRFGTVPVDVQWSLVGSGFDPKPVRYRRYLIDAGHSNLRSVTQHAELEIVEDETWLQTDGRTWTTRLSETSMTLMTFETGSDP
ncbi:MAG: hypothetical protein FJY97_10255 [candidate division Zixibacteria bacterium]|nr:hypothetical protein [candidate division Zixibacteria bacterium]